MTSMKLFVSNKIQAAQPKILTPKICQNNVVVSFSVLKKNKNIVSDYELFLNIQFSVNKNCNGLPTTKNALKSIKKNF